MGHKANTSRPVRNAKQCNGEVTYRPNGGKHIQGHHAHLFDGDAAQLAMDGEPDAWALISCAHLIAKCCAEKLILKADDQQAAHVIKLRRLLRNRRSMYVHAALSKGSNDTHDYGSHNMVVCRRPPYEQMQYREQNICNNLVNNSQDVRALTTAAGGLLFRLSSCDIFSSRRFVACNFCC